MTTLIGPARNAEVRPGKRRRRLLGRPPGLWLWPLLATLALALYGIDGPQLGTDELVTWNVGERSTDRIWALVHNVDAVHATYYLLMHGWMAVFGDSQFALRMPSALAMSGAAACVALIGNRLFGRRAGLCGGLLFVLIPAVSRFAQEARSYALVVLAATLATYLLLRALDRTRSGWRWAAYGMCVAVVGLLHLVALTVVLGHVALLVFRFVRRERGGLWGFGLALAAGVACVVPVVVLGRSQASRQLFWLAAPGAWGLVDIWPQVFASALCAGVVITLAALAWREAREGLVLCLTVAVVPPLVLWAASHGEVSYFRFQYALFTVPAWAVLAGAGLARVTRPAGKSRLSVPALPSPSLPSPSLPSQSSEPSEPALPARPSRRSWLPVVVGLAVLGLLVLPDQRRVRGPFEHDVPHAADYAGAARTIEKYYRPGDAVVYVRGAPWMLDQGVRYYLQRDLKLPEVFLAKTAAEHDELYPVHCTQPAACLKGESRIWVVVPGNGPDSLDAVPGQQARALRAKYTTYGSEQLSGLTVTLLQRKP
ncbi:glycosyltransferase family 39 protein [Streptomyces sp. NPDC048349]|uniref:glycosyltransferase family 39 protein n=1 Tax=Streptomyces sp. NPDC048349 TaxID=3155486 RepID=UPI00341AC15A